MGVVHSPTKSSNTATKGEIPLLEATFNISVNPTIAEEELLAEVIGLTLPQADTRCEWHYRFGTLQRLRCYTNSPDNAILKVALELAPWIIAIACMGERKDPIHYRRGIVRIFLPDITSMLYG